MSTTVDAGDAVQSLVAGYESTLSSVSIKAVGSQIVLMSILSVSVQPLPSAQANTSQLGTLMAFSVLRPRDKRVYAPKVGHHSLNQLRMANIRRSNTFKRQRNRIQRSIFNLHRKSRTVYLVGSVRFCIRQRRPCCNRSVSMLRLEGLAVLICTGAGLDGVTFLRCLRLLRMLFLAVSILVGGVLLYVLGTS